MSALQGLGVGDHVAMLAPMTAPDLDNIRHMYWVRGEIVSIKGQHVTARHVRHVTKYALDTGEQVNGHNEDRGPGWIEPLNDAARLRIAEGALKKSNYERRCSVLEVISQMVHGLTTEALERTAAFMAGEDDILDTA